MTDTPRTEAELLSIFADNNTGAITPQDMRDFVVSSYPGTADGAGELAIYTGSTLATLPAAATTSSYGARIPLTWPVADRTDYSSIPDAWFDAAYTLSGSDPTNSWGSTWPTDSGIMLPTGTFQVRIAITYDQADAAFLIPVQVMFDQAQYDPDFVLPADRSQPYWYDGYYNGATIVVGLPAINGDHAKFVATICDLHVTNDDPDPQPFVGLAYNAGKTTDTHIDYQALTIRKVA